MTRYYRITIEPLTGPFGQPDGRKKVCESEGENISEALDELSVELHGFNEDVTIHLPEGFEVF